MKIVFLDIDWVLIPIRNSEPMNGLDLMGLTHIERSKQMLSPDACTALVKILQDPSVFIVMSSSWRHYWEWCKDLLQDIPLIRNEDGQYGINYWYTLWDRVFSKTWSATEGGRSTEILMWLDEYHRTCEHLGHVTHWVAIDDEFYDMKAIRRIGKLIKTEPSIWLTSEHADEIISLLNR